MAMTLDYTDRERSKAKVARGQWQELKVARPMYVSIYIVDRSLYMSVLRYEELRYNVPYAVYTLLQ